MKRRNPYPVGNMMQSNLHSFGMLMKERKFESEHYRYGFNSQEKVDEVSGEGNSLNYTFRIYDPRISRFFAVDPLAIDYPYWTPYQFAGLIPIRFVELEGLEPGEPFETKKDAALNFSSIYGAFSIQENREYSATIYSYTDKGGNVKYTYNNPKRGSKAGAPVNPVRKKEGKAVAGIHAHGAFDRRYENNIFSSSDIVISLDQGVPEYLSTPSGELRIIDPSVDEIRDRVRGDPGTVVDGNSPSDPSDLDKVNRKYAVREGLTRKERRLEIKEKTKENRKTRKEYKQEYKRILKKRND